jgi:hypothetical protein
VVGGLINQDAGASNGSGKDPNFDFVDTLNHGSSISSASGAFSGTLSSRTIDLNAGANGGFRPSWLFNLSADGMQTLVVGGAFDHDWQQTSYGSSFAATATRSIYSFGPYARYDVGDVYLYGAAEGLLGSGSENNAATGGSGSFGTAGFAAAAKLGRTFMLFDALDYGAPLDALDYGAPPPPTRHRPRPIGGYGLQLDVSGHGGYFDDRAGGFTDTVGFVNGTQQYHYGFVGVTAKLLATVATGNRLIWYPFLALTVDQKLGFTHTLDVPAQAGFGGDVLSFNEAQTTGGLASEKWRVPCEQ